MTLDEEKKYNHMMWCVKGRLVPEGWSTEDLVRMYDSYFKRMWGNHEFCYHEEGFEEAWKNKLEKLDSTEENHF